MLQPGFITYITRHEIGFWTNIQNSKLISARRSKLLMIIPMPISLLRVLRSLQSRIQSYHSTAIYLLRPLYLIRYVLLLLLGIIFIFRYLIVIKSTLPIVQFIVFLFTLWVGECMKARYSGLYELRPLLIDVPWNNLNRTFTDKYVLYEADLWLKLFTSNLVAVVFSYTDAGKNGLRPLPFVLSILLDFNLRVVKQYRQFKTIGYNKGLLHCIIDSCRYMNRALRNRL